MLSALGYLDYVRQTFDTSALALPAPDALDLLSEQVLTGLYADRKKQLVVTVGLATLFGIASAKAMGGLVPAVGTRLFLMRSLGQGLGWAGKFFGGFGSLYGAAGSIKEQVLHLGALDYALKRARTKPAAVPVIAPVVMAPVNVQVDQTATLQGIESIKEELVRLRTGQKHLRTALTKEIADAKKEQIALHEEAGRALQEIKQTLAGVATSHDLLHSKLDRVLAMTLTCLQIAQNMSRVRITNKALPQKKVLKVA